MERRGEERRSRRAQISFWQRGSEKRYRGYSANISSGGMYIDTNHLAPKGTRIRLEVGSDREGFMAEAVVARVNKSVQALRPSGMGLRFLTIEELLGELMPEMNSVPDASEAPLPEGTYQLRFATHQQFFEVYERDLATGGLFIPTGEPAPLNETITVLLSVADSGIEPVELRARVVHRLDPSMPEGSGAGNLMAGMGVEILNFDTSLTAIWTLVAQLEGRG